MGAEEIIYGARNGDTIKVHDETSTPNDPVFEERVFWAPRFEVNSTDRSARVEITVTSFKEAAIPGDGSEVAQEPAQTIYAEWDYRACNRAIKAIRKHRDRVYGKPE